MGTTAAGPLSTSDIFIGIQKTPGVNLSDVDKSRFLNHASCQCKRDVWIKAILINATSAAKAQALPGTDTVTLMIGQNCASNLYYYSCLTLDVVPLSEFRLNGITVHTTVDVLAKAYGVANNVITSGSGGDTGVIVTGSGGADGGIASEVTTATDPCAVGDAYSQPVYVFVESTPTTYNDGTAQTNIVIDGTPPPAPSPVTIQTANEALIVDWPSVNNNNNVPDLQGYQVFCTRGNQEKVFKDGTFSTSVDSCPATDAVYADGGVTPDAGTSPVPLFPEDYDPLALANANTHYICSDFLSTSTTSHRVQILQNDIQYGIAVAAVDLHGNATLAYAPPTAPQQTLDFYYTYRHNHPQGQAVGGCSLAGNASSGQALSALAVMAAALGFTGKRRRGPRS